MLNDVGVNLIQVETNTAPTVEPVETGVLGIAGEFYRGSKVMRFRGASSSLLQEVYRRLGTPYENFRNHAYYNVLGHIQNSTTFGSSLVVHRLRGQNSTVARTYVSKTGTAPNFVYTPHDSKTVMRLVKNTANSVARVSHQYNSSDNTYDFLFDKNLNAPTTPLPNERVTFKISGKVFGFVREKSSDSYVSDTSLVNKVIFSQSPSEPFTLTYIDSSFTGLCKVNISAPISISSFSDIETDHAQYVFDIFYVDNLEITTNYPTLLQETYDFVFDFLRRASSVLASKFNSADSLNPIKNQDVYADDAIISYPIHFRNVPSSSSSNLMLLNTVTQTAVNSLTYTNVILRGDPNNFITDGDLYVDPTYESDFLLDNLNTELFLKERYRAGSLSAIALSVNLGEKIDFRRNFAVLNFFNGNAPNNVVMAESQNELPRDVSSSIFSCQFVTQAIGIPIEQKTEQMPSVLLEDQVDYNVLLPSSSQVGRFFYSAAQAGESDWGQWGNNLSVVVSPSQTDPTFRKLTVYLKTEGRKVVVEEIEDTEQSVLSFLRGSGYVSLNLDESNTYNYMPFISNLELPLRDGNDGNITKSVYLGSAVESTGAYAFLGTSATSITCPEVTSGVSGIMIGDMVDIIDVYATVALSANKTAIFTLPRNISRNEIFNIFTKSFLKNQSNLILYRANGAVSDGRGGRIATSLVGHIHGAAYVRWRLSQSIFPNIVPKGESTFLLGVFGLDKEQYSKEEITDYVRNLGVNPVVLSVSGFVIEGARTMSRKNVHYSIHATELTNFYVESIVRFASFLKSEFNDESAQKRFAQRITDFTRTMYDSRCIESDGGFENNFQIKVDASVNPIESRRKRIFNARIKVRWIEQIEAINIFFEKTDESVNASLE